MHPNQREPQNCASPASRGTPHGYPVAKAPTHLRSADGYATPPARRVNVFQSADTREGLQDQSRYAHHGSRNPSVSRVPEPLFARDYQPSMRIAQAEHINYQSPQSAHRHVLSSRASESSRSHATKLKPRRQRKMHTRSRIAAAAIDQPAPDANDEHSHTPRDRRRPSCESGFTIASQVEHFLTTFQGLRNTHTIGVITCNTRSKTPVATLVRLRLPMRPPQKLHTTWCLRFRRKVS
jgi:hypothetical protein